MRKDQISDREAKISAITMAYESGVVEGFHKLRERLTDEASKISVEGFKVSKEMFDLFNSMSEEDITDVGSIEYQVRLEMFIKGYLLGLRQTTNTDPRL